MKPCVIFNSLIVDVMQTSANTPERVNSIHALLDHMFALSHLISNDDNYIDLLKNKIDEFKFDTRFNYKKYQRMIESYNAYLNV